VPKAIPVMPKPIRSGRIHFHVSANRFHTGKNVIGVVPNAIPVPPNLIRSGTNPFSVAANQFRVVPNPIRSGRTPFSCYWESFSCYWESISRCAKPNPFRANPFSCFTYRFGAGAYTTSVTPNPICTAVGPFCVVEDLFAGVLRSTTSGEIATFNRR
jgi:hypothetical protein